MNSRLKGFTIVELLIVIVVIAILAAISIVAYSGIQQRSKETKLLSGVSTYVKTFQQYKAVNSAYPTDSGCLGAGYQSNSCWYDGSTAALGVNVNLDSSLAQFISTKYDFGPERMAIGISSLNRGGLAYFNNDATYGNRLVYYLSGINRSCGIPGAVGANEGGIVTQCNISLP